MKRFSMRMSNTTRGIFAAVIVAALVAGCRTKPEDQAETPERLELDEIGQAYKLYLEAKKQPPSQPAQLKPYTPGFVYLARALQGDKYTVIWGANPDRAADPANTVLAYEKDAPTNGGWTLMADGTVKHLDAQTFQAVPKALPH
jgi:hypothetical protein